MIATGGVYKGQAASKSGCDLTHCEDCGKPLPAGVRQRSLGYLDPRSPLAYCDRRFRLAVGQPALSGSLEVLKEWRKQVRDFDDADETENVFAMVSSCDTDDRMTVDVCNKRARRREGDARAGIGHCAVVVCTDCRQQPKKHVCNQG